MCIYNDKYMFTYLQYTFIFLVLHESTIPIASLERTSFEKNHHLQTKTFHSCHVSELAWTQVNFRVHWVIIRLAGEFGKCSFNFRFRITNTDQQLVTKALEHLMHLSAKNSIPQAHHSAQPWKAQKDRVRIGRPHLEVI